MKQGRSYWLVREGGSTAAVIADARKQMRDFNAAVNGLQKEIGASAILTYGHLRFAAAQFPGDPPTGWRKCSEGYTPDKRSKTGRAIQKRIDSIPGGVDAWELSSMLSKALGGDYTHWGNDVVSLSSFETWDEKSILSIPEKCSVTPPDCERLKMSEYWAIRESARGVVEA